MGLQHGADLQWDCSPTLRNVMLCRAGIYIWSLKKYGLCSLLMQMSHIFRLEIMGHHTTNIWPTVVWQMSWIIKCDMFLGCHMVWQPHDFLIAEDYKDMKSLFPFCGFCIFFSRSFGCSVFFQGFLFTCLLASFLHHVLIWLLALAHVSKFESAVSVGHLHASGVGRPH